MRAAARLTKGMYGDANKKNSEMEPQLEFADSTREEVAETKQDIKNKEFLVLFWKGLMKPEFRKEWSET